jgi:hypothetical protein
MSALLCFSDYFKSIPRIYRKTALFIAAVAILAPGNLFAIATVSILLPDCSDPYDINLMEVEIALDPGDSLKVYDIRIQFDTLQVVPDLSQIQQGSWFQAAGPTFFWYDMIDDILIVNQAVLGPGLAVFGSGIAFSVPVENLTPGYSDLTFTLTELYNAQAEVFPSIAIPHQFAAPCTDFQLQITYLPALDRVELEWLPQSWTQYYEILVSDEPYGPMWQVIDNSYTTNWWEPRTGIERRFYRVRSVLNN